MPKERVRVSAARYRYRMLALEDEEPLWCWEASQVRLRGCSVRHRVSWSRTDRKIRWKGGGGNQNAFSVDACSSHDGGGGVGETRHGRDLSLISRYAVVPVRETATVPDRRGMYLVRASFRLLSLFRYLSRIASSGKSRRRNCTIIGDRHSIYRSQLETNQALIVRNWIELN